MKRDLDLMREILLRVEASDDLVFPPYLPSSSRPQAEIAYQVIQLSEAGYIKASFTPMQGPPGEMGVIVRLTHSGHEYLDGVRDPKVWERTKKELAKVPGGSGPLEFVKDFAARALVELYKSSSGP
jgi:hypothetical protein